MKYQRQLEILQYINEKGSATISELLERFTISKATLNRDLTNLENNFSIKKVHGGVISNIEAQTFDYPISQKELQHKDEKILIAKAVVKMIHTGQTILFDSGSTIWYLAKELVLRDDITDLTVITNDIKIAYTLTDNPNISIYVLGGFRLKDTYDLYEPSMLNTLSQLNIDTYFMAASAFDSHAGITHFDQTDITIKNSMMSRSNKIILCSDSSKYAVVKRWKLCNLNEVDEIFTDYHISDKNIEDIKLLCKNLHIISAN